MFSPSAGANSDRTGRGDFFVLPFDAQRQGVACRPASTTLNRRATSNCFHVETAVSVRHVDEMATTRLHLSAALAGLPPTALARRSMRAPSGTAVVQTRRRLLMTAVLGIPHHDGLATHRCADRRPRRWRRSTEQDRDRKERERCEHRREREPRHTTGPNNCGCHECVLRGSSSDLKMGRRLGQRQVAQLGIKLPPPPPEHCKLNERFSRSSSSACG